MYFSAEIFQAKNCIYFSNVYEYELLFKNHVNSQKLLENGYRAIKKKKKIKQHKLKIPNLLHILSLSKF